MRNEMQVKNSIIGQWNRDVIFRARPGMGQMVRLLAYEIVGLIAIRGGNGEAK